jgi:hypothetical protein
MEKTAFSRPELPADEELLLLTRIAIQDTQRLVLGSQKVLAESMEMLALADRMLSPQVDKPREDNGTASNHRSRLYKPPAETGNDGA